MSKKDPRKLEKKRRKERERQRQERARNVSLAYHGNKYKTTELVGVLFATEVAIHEAFLISERQLADRDVRETLEDLIEGLRGGTLQVQPALESPGQPEPRDEEEDEAAPSLAQWNILERWKRHFSTHPYPGRDNLIGVLRTILGSIEVWGNRGLTPRGYLHYLEGFMKEAGVNVQVLTPEEARRLGYTGEAAAALPSPEA